MADGEPISPLSPLVVPVLGEGRTTFSTVPSRSHTPFQKRSQSPTVSEHEFDTNSKASIRRAMTSFENLVALANYQEHLKYVLKNRKDTLNEARKMVWRDRGEPVVELADVEECFKWALKGGMRKFLVYLAERYSLILYTGAASLAFNARACFNIVLALIRLPSIPRSVPCSGNNSKTKPLPENTV